MFLPALLPQSPVPDRQPTTMEVVGYQRVQHSLPDGRPDLAAPDNSFVRTTTQWFLVADSDEVKPDDGGVRHLRVPAFAAKNYVRYDVRGRASKSLVAKFKEVTFEGVPLRKPIPDGSATSGESIEVDVPKGQRLLYFQIRSLVDKVETHTDGKRRLTRSARNSFWTRSSQGWPQGKPFVPERRPMVQLESGPHVQVDPPTFGYGPTVLPKDDDL